MTASLLEHQIRKFWKYFLNQDPNRGVKAYRLFCRASPYRINTDPFKLLWVDPDTIVKNVKNDDHPCVWGTIEAGNWDKKTSAFAEESPNRVISTWIQTNDTTLLEQELSDAPGTTAEPRYDGTDIGSRIQELEALRDSLKKEGYLTQTALLQSDETHREASNDPAPAELNEITVDIDRHGELLFRRCGQHRLCLAQLLNIESVCVLVGRRHTQWQQVRNKIKISRDGDLPPEFADHPDIQEFIDDE